MPTRYCRTVAEARDVLAGHRPGSVVVKPTVSGGSRDTGLFAAADPGLALAERILAAGACDDPARDRGADGRAREGALHDRRAAHPRDREGRCWCPAAGSSAASTPSAPSRSRRPTRARFAEEVLRAVAGGDGRFPLRCTPASTRSTRPSTAWWCSRSSSSSPRSTCTSRRGRSVRSRRDRASGGGRVSDGAARIPRPGAPGGWASCATRSRCCGSGPSASAGQRAASVLEKELVTPGRPQQGLSEPEFVQDTVIANITLAPSAEDRRAVRAGRGQGRADRRGRGRPARRRRHRRDHRRLQQAR